MSTNTVAKKDTYQVITDTIIEAMESRKIIPWRKTWTHDQLSPMNYYSKHQYRGINALLCALVPYDTPFFMTVKQANRLGGKVSKGAKSIPIVFWKTYYKNEAGEAISEEIAKKEGFAKKAMYPRYYRVFNIEDIEGIKFELPEVEIREEKPTLEYCEKILTHMPNPPQIEYRPPHQPSYFPGLDKVCLPERNQFESSEKFYATTFHELIHSTGHSSRLDRKGVMERHKFGSCEYSAEELVAEIGAWRLAQIGGITDESVFDNSTAYIAGWLKAFADDKKMLLVTANQARKATDYIMRM